mgnify:CR=1 FL=1
MFDINIICAEKQFVKRKIIKTYIFNINLICLTYQIKEIMIKLLKIVPKGRRP